MTGDLAKFVRALPEAMGFPPSWLFGLAAGLFIRRLWLAVPVAAVLSPLANTIGDSAFSDAHPRLIPIDLLLFATTAGLYAVIGWSVRTAIRRTRGANG